jgi:transcription antitermination protein NusB
MTTAKVNPRSTARLAAVQALYQMEMTGGSSAWVITEFRHHRLGRDIDGEIYAKADETLFVDIVDGVDHQRARIDTTIEAHLSDGWTLPRIDSTLRQLLRAASYELLVRLNTPTAVIINEYVEVANAFVERNEAGFINGVLDRLAKTVRSAAA